MSTTRSSVILNTENNPGNWLTARRLRAHGIILAACLWIVYAWILWTPGLRDRNHKLKGTDFLHFYTLGSLALEHRGEDLYNMQAQAALAAQRVPEAAGIRYLPLYPPQVSLLFAPLAGLPYVSALALWWAISAVIYFGCVVVLSRFSPNLRDHLGLVILLAAANPAFFHLIAWGQTSALALACFTAMFFLLKKDSPFLAGLALGCLAFKPQLGIAAAIIFLSIGAWKTIVGAVVSAAAQVAAGILYYGAEPFRAWIRSLANVRATLSLLEPRPYQTHSLRTFWSMLLPWVTVSLTLYLISAAVVLGLASHVWKRGASVPLALRYAVLLLSTVLCAPHLTAYDLVILAPAILLLADWIVGKGASRATWSLATLLYLVYVLPLVGPLARYTHVQLSVIAMSACLYVIWQLSRGMGAATARAEC